MKRGITSKIPLLNLTGRQNIAIFKGVLGYALSLTLVFLRHFDKLNKVPTALTAVSLVAIAGQPGSTVGACVNQALLGLVGWGCGALGFVVLAELGLSTVAQGFVFFVFVYLAALVKAQSMKYFTASLLAILLAFNGLYTSVLLRGKFSKVYFYAFIEAYLWGFAIVIGINFFVFPTTAERQLRLLLLSSIDNISTFTHLIAKTYTLELTPAERALRDSLHLTIRTDMLFLTQKMVDVRMEVNLTRFSYSDYAKSIEHVRQLQQGLLSAYSSLVAIERTTDAGTLEEMRKEVAETGTREQFWKLRKAINIVISDLITAFDPDHSSPAHTDSISTDLGAPTRDDFQPSSSSKSIKDEELGDDTSALPILESAEQMEKTRKKLRDELGSPVRQGNGSAVVSQEWEAFKTQQRAATLAMLAGGDATDNELLLNAPGPSMGDEFRKALSGSQENTWTASLANPAAAPSAAEKSSKTIIASLHQFITWNILLILLVLLSGMETVLHQLQTFHKFIAPVDVAPRKKTIRFHFLESLPKPAVHDHDDPSEDETPKTKLSLGQAVANLRGEGSAFKPSRSSLWKDIASLEKLARSDTSLYAFKTACAVIVYTVFILAPSLQKFFTTYGLTSGILTIVVAMSPTLGNSILVFAIQIASTSFGTIFGMAVLYIFKHVGGFYFNPYGIVCLLSLYAIPLCWIIYIKPIYWAGGFLAMNASSVLVITEWVYREVPGSIRPTFDSPALRAGKALVAMSIALGIAAVFQIFILRSPARRALRAQLAGVAASLASYNVLLGVLIEAGVPSNPEDKPSSDVESMTVISKALISREAKIQMDLLGLLPLLKFAAAEPTFGQPFEGEALVRVIRSQQLVLDRLRQARMAMGGDGFSTELRELFINELSPYRGQVKRFARSLFFFVSTSLATKTPLPSELPSMGAVSKAIQHDAFVLSRRIARSEHGQAVIGSQGFVRVWFYLISMASVLYHLENTEPDLRILFGHADDNSHLFSE